MWGCLHCQEYIGDKRGIVDIVDTDTTQTQKPDVTPPSNGHHARPASSPAPVPQTRKSHRKLFIVTTLVILVAIGMGWSWWLFGRSTAFDENNNIDPKGYQAIFLTNGQVYFGKLSNLNHKYITITDIYYLQVSSNTGLQGSTSSGDNSSQVSLAKLGSELHGPKDEMYIASDQMLFWENLNGSSSKVVQAIDKYQAQHQQ